MKAWLRTLSNQPLWIVFACAILIMQGLTLYRQRAVGTQPARKLVETPSAPFNVALGALPAKGNADAKVVLIEFSDFECPFCKKFSTEAGPSIDKDYVQTGKIRHYFRHFPLPSHTSALKLAGLAECANGQGKFWEAHDGLFRDGEGYEKSLDTAGIDMTRFRDCTTQASYKPSIDRDIEDGKKAGIQGTPTFFIGIDKGNGEMQVQRIIRGAAAFEVFKTNIDEIASGLDGTKVGSNHHLGAPRVKGD